MEQQFDYVVVGGGSAGCVVAARLSEDPTVRVLLLEAGPEPRTPWIRLPAGVSRLMFPGTYNWGYSTEPEPHVNGRRIYAPRGRTLGGSSAINGMAYVRGHPEDYDVWAQLGNRGWNWDCVLPFFKKSEHFEGEGSSLHGRDGELWVSSPNVRHPASRDFVEAGVQLGLRRTEDLNDEQQEGISFLHFTIRNGQRHSTSDAFLSKARQRRNLKVETDAHAHKVLVTEGRASAVVYQQGGESHVAAARREIVLCGGTLNSPKLLMLSGIGPAAHLAEHGIGVVVNLPGVGQNLQDHLYTNLTFRVTPGSSVNEELQGVRKFAHGLQYMLQRRGLLTMGTSQAGAFVRAMPGANRPDVQIMFRPMSWEFDPQGVLQIGRSPAITVSHCPLRPHSRGVVALRSAKFDDPPRIFANYLDALYDRQATVAGVRFIRRILATEPLATRVVAESVPGPEAESDEEIIDFAQRMAQSMHHWVGTCRMGRDGLAVVDEELRVHGLTGLRVVDASIMPNIPSGNTNAPTIMVAEKGAEMIKLAARRGAAPAALVA
jgi:choline dehydrogenase